MTLEANKAIVHRLTEEAFNRANTDVIDELCAPSFRNRTPSLGVTLDREGYKQYLRQLHAAFASFRNVIEDLVAEDDVVVAHLTTSGIHRGEFGGIAPTNREVHFASVVFFRLAGGKITERWQVADNLLLLQQLGVVGS